MDERHKLNDKENWGLRNMCGVSMLYRWKNEGVRRRIDVKRKINDRVDRRVLK